MGFFSTFYGIIGNKNEQTQNKSHDSGYTWKRKI
jgi:hypothetical protein